MKLGQREDIGFGLFVDVVVFNKQVHFLTFGTEREILSLGFDFKAGPKIMWLRPNSSTRQQQKVPSGHHESKGCWVGWTHTCKGFLCDSKRSRWRGIHTRQEQIKSQHTLRLKDSDKIISCSFSTLSTRLSLNSFLSSLKLFIMFILI